MNSIIKGDSPERCLLCGRTDWIEDHHIFGASNRKNSEKYGLKAHLCHWCHNEPPRGAHHNAAVADYLHRIGQKAFEEQHGSREDFVRIFGKNYLGD